MNMMTRMPHANGPLFPRRLAILPDESLIGFVARVSAEHGWRRVIDLLAAIGVPRARPSAFGDLTSAEVEALSGAFRLSADEVARRAYADAADALARRPMATFYGERIAAKWLLRVVRRYAPLALRDSAHHRAMWDVAPLPFCAETFEILRSDCPCCGRLLGWRQTCGVAFCERCRERDDTARVDLRTVEPVLTPEGDREALRFAADLIHPDGERRARARTVLPAGLQGHPPGEILALLVSVAEAAPARPASDDGVERALGEARRIAEAARVVMSWPDGVADLMRRRGAEAGRGSSCDIRKTDLIAPFVGLSPGLGAIVRSAVDAILVDAPRLAPGQVARRAASDPGLMTLQQAANALGLKSVDMRDLIRRGGLEAIGGGGEADTILLRTSEVAALKQDLAASLRPEIAAHSLGIGRSGLRRLVEAGHLQAATGAVALLRTDQAVMAASLDALTASLRRACRLSADQPGLIAADDAIRRLGPGEKRWDLLVAAILEGRVDAAIPADGTLGIDDILVEKNTDLQFMLDHEPWTDEPWRDVTEAAHWLGTNRSVIRRLCEGGLLPRSGHWLRSIAVGDLAAFTAQFMLGSEAASVARIAPRYLEEVLAARGVSPVARPGDGRTSVWERRAVNDAGLAPHCSSV